MIPSQSPSYPESSDFRQGFDGRPLCVQRARGRLLLPRCALDSYGKVSARNSLSPCKALKVKNLTGKGQSAAPLPGPGFRGQPTDTFLFVVIGLGHGGIGLVAARRANAFVLVVDPSRRLQGLLKIAGPAQRSRPSETIDFFHFLGDFNPGFRAYLLLDKGAGKDGEEVFGLHRLPTSGIKRWSWRFG